MKLPSSKVLLFIIVGYVSSFSITKTAFAQSVGRANPVPNITVSLNASSSTGIVNYLVYYGHSPGNYTNVVTLPSSVLTTTLVGLKRGTWYYIAATAKDDTGLESEYSTEVPFQLRNLPNPPTIKSVTSP